jgi:N-acetylglutamate synthase
MDLELIRHIETLAADAWPAETDQDLDGWRLRAHHGVTRRANSVLPNRDRGTLPLSEKLRRVEAFYTGQGLTTRYQLCPASQPEGLDAVLASRGYTTEALTSVQVAELADVLSGTGLRPDHDLTHAPFLSDDWFAVYCDSEKEAYENGRGRRAILERIAAPAAFALLRIEGHAAGVGLGVAQGEWLGIFCMVTHPEFRRRGVGRSVLHALAEWGREQHTERAYLQVMDDNLAALGLYAFAGFRTLHQYYYRTAPTVLA